MKKKYFLSGLLVLLILLIVYFVKGIYPFGSKYIAWGDMHAQLVPFYYNLYDFVYNGKSLLVDFTSGTVVNLFSNFAYYFSSPFSFIVLFFERSDIPLAVSIITILKISLAGITCNYFLDKMFKKLDNFYKVLLSVLYALSTYNLSLYIISGFLDIVYMFPLLLYSSYLLLHESKYKMFVIVLFLSIIFNFYLALMSLLFIFFASFVYLHFFENDNKKSRVTLLGISTLAALLMSSFLLLPVIDSITNSARLGFNFTELVNSKMGPVIDKFMFLTSSSLGISCLILSLFEFKKNKDWLKIMIPLLVFQSLPLIIEPINKMLHFGSYVYYPLRYGFILIFLFIVIAAFYLSKNNDKKNYKKVIPCIIAIISNLIIIFISHKYYNIFQESINKLTFSSNHKAFLLIILIVMLDIITFLFVFVFCKKSDKKTYFVLSITVLVFVVSSCLMYIMIDKTENKFHLEYDNLNILYKSNIEEGYHIKNNVSDLFDNYGFVSNKTSSDFFTSLIDDNMFMNYQKLGYNSNWMNVKSSGGNFFIDGILANKYILSDNLIKNEYYKFLYKVGSYYLYSYNLPISKAYLLDKDISIKDSSNSFDASNLIYKAFNNSDDIFEIYDYDINIYEKNISIEGKKSIYLEAINSYLSSEKVKTFNTFEIYINDEFYSMYPTKENNGSIYLGTFNNEVVNIKIKAVKDPKKFKNIYIGILDNVKMEKFFIDNYHDIDISSKSSINIKYESESDKLLFIPISYINGLNSLKVFDSFVGVNIKKGINNISIDYDVPLLKEGIIISVVGIMLFILLIKYSSVVTSVNILNNISYYIYLLLYSIFLLVFYIVPFIIFLYSFIK